MYGYRLHSQTHNSLPSFLLQVSLENGIVLNFDVRTLPSNLDEPSPSRFTLAAHDGAVSSIDVNPHMKGCIVTGGTDKLVKIWNVNDEENGKKSISLVTSRDLGVVRPLLFLNSAPVAFSEKDAFF